LLALEARLAGGGERGFAVYLHSLDHTIFHHAHDSVGVQVAKSAVPSVNIRLGGRAARDQGGLGYSREVVAFG
jgi:hypothetical protein